MLSTEPITKLEHTAGENWEITVGHGCTTEGERVKKCTDCNEIVERQIISAAHTPIVLKAVAATCAYEGLTEGSKCFVCSKILVEQEPVEKVAHDFVTVSATDPTCSEYGYTEGIKCSACLQWKVEPTKIDKLAHTETEDKAKAATCTQSGLTVGKHCTVCHTVTVQQKTVNKLGHDYGVYNNSCSRCDTKEYKEIASRLDLQNYSGDYDAVIYLDKCITTSNINEYWTVTVKDTSKYIRLVGEANKVYNIKFVVNSRQSALTVDFVNASIKAITADPVIKSESEAEITLGFYGEKCVITGKTGAAGDDASISSLSYDGKKGSNGSDAISITGCLVIKNGADTVQIKGGNGGKGGDGQNAAPAPQDGGDGGKGGDGAYAIKASSITIMGVDGHSSSSVLLSGGAGGKGGSGGEGFLWGDDGKNGSTGKTQSATTVTPTYK